LLAGRKKTWIVCSFTTPHIIYAGGAIKIKFTDTTKIPKVHPHCRSNSGNLHSTASTTISKDIGCYVEDNSWIITGFAEVTATQSISILG
jgi:hypothetical protein